MQAIILAGGEGTRLRPLTENKPKPMVEIGGAPILEHQLRQLRKAGITDVTICESYLPDVIQQYFGDGEKFGVRLKHMVLDRELQSAGAIKSAFESMPKEENDALVLYGDIISNVDLDALVNQHKVGGALVTAVTKKSKSQYGEWSFDEKGRAKSFQEKPLKDANAAMLVLNRGILDFLSEGKDLSKGVLEPMVESGGSVFQGFEHEGYWRDIADIAAVNEAERDIKEWQITPFQPEGSALTIEGK